MKRRNAHTTLSCLAAFGLVLIVAACSNMSTTQQRTLSGTAIGAGTGTAVSAMTGGCVSCGAAIGAVAGAAGGYIYDQTKK